MMCSLYTKYLKHLRNKKGQGMVEYVFIVAFIALALIFTLTELGSTLATKFTEFAVLIRG